MANSEDNADPRYTLIIVSDDGKLYKLTKGQWQTEENLLPAAGQGVVNQLTEFGAYVSYIPPDLAVGFGNICTVVNLKAILKNNS